MRMKLWFSLALLVGITILWYGNSLAATVKIDGYTAIYSSEIKQLPPSNSMWPDEWGPVVSTGSTYFEASNCAVSVTTTMTYKQHEPAGVFTKTMQASGSSPGGAGGANCYAKCSTGHGAMLKWYEPVKETSHHYITYNGETYHFVTNDTP